MITRATQTIRIASIGKGIRGGSIVRFVCLEKFVLLVFADSPELPYSVGA